MDVIFYEVEVENRVVKGRNFVRKIKGTQGRWYNEFLYFLAESEAEAIEYTKQELSRRRILGIATRRKERANIRREVRIKRIRRIV